MANLHRCAACSRHNRNLARTWLLKVIGSSPGHVKIIFFLWKGFAGTEMKRFCLKHTRRTVQTVTTTGWVTWLERRWVLNGIASYCICRPILLKDFWDLVHRFGLKRRETSSNWFTMMEASSRYPEDYRSSSTRSQAMRWIMKYACSKYELKQTFPSTLKLRYFTRVVNVQCSCYRCPCLCLSY